MAESNGLDNKTFYQKVFCGAFLQKSDPFSCAVNTKLLINPINVHLVCEGEGDEGGAVKVAGVHFYSVNLAVVVGGVVVNPLVKIDARGVGGKLVFAARE